MNMMPNSTKHRRKRKVLVVLGWHDPHVLRGIGRYALEAGWHLDSRGLFTNRVPLGWQGDGMLASDSDRVDVRRFVQRQTKRQPTVLFGVNNPGLQAPCVSVDNETAGRMAAEHLLYRGYDHLVWFSFFNSNVAAARRNGFVDAIAVAGRHCTLCEMDIGDGNAWTWTRRRQWILRQLRKIKKPCGLFATDDQLAAEVIEVCLDAGWRVPGDVAVVGAGNIELACCTSPVPISSVEMCDEEAAYQAATLLDQLIDDGKPPMSPILIQPQGVVARKSSDFLAISDPSLQKAIRFLEENYALPLTMEDIATAAGISRRTLYYLFATHLIHSPAGHLLDVRMKRAKQLLLETDGKLSRIAVDCGLGSSRNMNRCFWRLEGLSPRAWQQAHRNR
jgi:LacI family transcriptional regulator